MFHHLPTLGVGVGFRSRFSSAVFLHRQQVDFLEITAEHYLDATPAKRQELEVLHQHFTLIPHALNLSIGSAEGVDTAYVRKLARFIHRLKPPWWSEHLAFTRAGGVEIGHLTPLPYTREAIEVVCHNVEVVRHWLDIPLILENITTMLTLPGAEMTAAEFLTAVLERTDCGLLLDVTNLYTDAVNHHYDPADFLAQIPLERVVQLHFAGGHWDHGVLIDSHSQPTPPEVWSLLHTVLAQAPVKGVVLERDTNFPAFTDLLQELAQARHLGQRYGRWD